MRKSKKEIVAIASAMMLLFIILAVSFYFSVNPFSSKNVPKIVLPQDGEGLNNNGFLYYGQEKQSFDTLEITPQNVLDVIGTMKRPTVYSCERKSVVYYNGRAARTSELCYTSGEYTKTEILAESGAPKENIVSGREYSFIWSAGENQYYTCKKGEISADDVQSIPTYEDVLALSSDSISSAEYVTYDGQGCIFVEYSDEITGYDERYWISTDSGLLIFSQTADVDGEIIYESSAEKIKYEVNEEVFRLADGRMAQDAEQELTDKAAE